LRSASFALCVFLLGCGSTNSGFEDGGLDCRVRRITTVEFGAKAPRPRTSILRSEKGAPALPHWRDGLRACLAALGYG